MEKREGYRGVGGVYNHFLIAAELLAKNSDDSALLKYHALQDSKTTWKKAFEKSFGMTVEEFYDLFEEHRAAGFPDPNRPTPTGPQTVDDYIVWKVGDEVSSTAEAETRETVLAVHNYAVGIGMPRIGSPITIFLHRNLDALAAEFEATTGRELENRVGPDFAAGRNPFANGSNWVVVNTSADRYQEWSAETRERQLGGHLTDALQREMSVLALRAQRDQVPPGGPAWLLEGSEKYITYQAFRSTVPESCDPTRSSYARISESEDRPLSEAETSEDFWVLENSSAHGFLAVELLAEQADPEAIMGYFASLRPGAAWQEAFQTNFGMTVAEFYQLFEERRAAGFLEPGSPESADRKMSAPGPFDHLLQDPSLPPFIRWDVESTVDSRDVEAAIWGVKLMGELQQSLGLPDSEVPINIVIYKDMEKMACNYAIAVGWDLETSRKYWANAGGVSGRGNIYLRASTPQRLRTEPNLLMRTMVHELTHAHFQAGISGLMTDLSGHSRGSTEVPRWLVEGTAMLVTAMLLRENYPENYYQHERFRAEEASSALATGLTLRDSETWPPSGGGTVGMDEAGLNIVGCIYSCGYFAAELLASRVGVGKLFDYYLLLEPWMTPRGSEQDFPRPGWRLAFEKAYDMTVEEFYDLFEEHRAAGFPDPNRPTPTGPQTVDDYIVWKVGDEVSSTAEAETRETVLAVHNYAVGIGMPRIGSPITIFLHRNLDALAAEFEATTGREFENRVGPDFAAGRNPFANGSNLVMVNTSADRYQEWSAETRERQLGGHLTDALQREMSVLALRAQRDQVPPGGPAWLLEGSEKYITYQALRSTVPESCDPTRSSYARISESEDRPLSEAETSEDFWVLENSSAHGFLAVELLAEQADPECPAPSSSPAIAIRRAGRPH